MNAYAHDVSDEPVRLQDPAVLSKELGWTDDDTNENNIKDKFPNLDHQLSILLEAKREAVEKDDDDDDGSTGAPTKNIVADESESSSGDDLLRGTIFGGSFEYNPNYIVPTYSKSKDEEDFLKKALLSNFIFATLANDELQQLIGSMQRQVVTTPGTKVIEQGTVGDYFYVVQSGKVVFLKGSDELGRCESGGSFGELALLYATPRAVSCVATESW
jgi:Cyclic nucleotide-binding domain